MFATILTDAAAVVGIVFGSIIGPRWVIHGIRHRTRRANEAQLANLVKELAEFERPDPQVVPILMKTSSALASESRSFSCDLRESGLPWILGAFLAGGATLIPAPLVLSAGGVGTTPVALLVYIEFFLFALLVSGAVCYFCRGRKFVAGELHRADRLPPECVSQVRDMLQSSFAESGTAITRTLLESIEELKSERSAAADAEVEKVRLTAALEVAEDVNRGLHEKRQDLRRQVGQLCKTMGLLTGLAHHVSLFLHRVIEPNETDLVMETRRVLKKLVEVFGGERSNRSVLYVISKNADLAYPLAAIHGLSTGRDFAQTPVDITDPDIAAFLSAGRMVVWRGVELPALGVNGWFDVMLLPIPHLERSGRTGAIRPEAFLRLDSKTGELSNQLKGVVGDQQARALAASVDTVLYLTGVKQEERYRIAKDSSPLTGAAG